jgi:hypothetical protein
LKADHSDAHLAPAWPSGPLRWASQATERRYLRLCLGAADKYGRAACEGDPRDRRAAERAVIALAQDNSGEYRQLTALTGRPDAS